jgi:hypothetical protein
MKRFCFLVVLITWAALPAQAQTGPCTEGAIKQGTPPSADDMFSYMPPYGRPVIGRGAVQQANTRNFSARTNITREWAADHRIVSTPAGDMAYEYGTQKVGYTEGGQHTEFEAAMLIVYRAKGSVCETAALTMNPLEDTPQK